MIGLTFEELKALKPCKGALQRAEKALGRQWTNKVTVAQAREAGISFDEIIWAVSALSKKDKDIERRLCLCLADCAAHVLHVLENKFPQDARPRNAIIAARQIARGEMGVADMAAARDAAWAAALAARDAAWDAWFAAWAAWAARAAWDAAPAARDAVPSAWDARDAAGAAEKEWQFDRLIMWMSDPEPDDWPLPTQEREVA